MAKKRTANGLDEKSLELILKEQRYNAFYLLRIYERVEAKEGVLLAAAFGVLAYLYAVPTNTPCRGNTVLGRLGVPCEDYGVVIYLIAASFFLFGLFRLILTVFGKTTWRTPYETVKTDYSQEYTDNLMYMKERHDNSKTFNLETFTKRNSKLIVSFFSILISAIILIVIKTLS